MRRDRDIWGLPLARQPRRRADESPSSIAERMQLWAELIGQLLGAFFAGRPRSSPPPAAQGRLQAPRVAPPRDVVPPHPYAERIPSAPRSDLADGLRTLARASHGADGRAHARALDRVRRSAPDLVDYFAGDYVAAREAGLELRIALQSRAVGVALGTLLPKWRARAAAAKAATATDEGGSCPPPPSPDGLTF